MATEELPVEDCDHLGRGWCAACRPPHDDDEPVDAGRSRFSTDLHWWDPNVTIL